MSTELVKDKVFEFLKDFPPFNLLRIEQLKAVSDNVQEVVFEPGQIIFGQGDAPGPSFYVVYEGSIELRRKMDDADALIDVCDEGDVFGVRAMIAKKEYLTTANAVERSTLFAIPCDFFRPILTENPKVSMYFAAGFAAGQPVVRQSLLDTNEGRKDLNSKTAPFPVFSSGDVLSIQGIKKLISCPSKTSIQEVARKMNDHGSDSMIIVDNKSHPVGIVTDGDFRHSVLLGKNDISDSVSKIMSSPVLTINPTLPVSDIILLMMQSKKRHLCITKDGTPQSEALGVISERDLLLIQGNNPAGLLKEIEHVSEIRNLTSIRHRAEGLLKTYLEQELPISFISKVITEINDALVLKAVSHAEAALEAEGLIKPNLEYCWMSLGSSGREEQLLRTDQDNALVYEDPSPGDEKLAHQYFVNLGKQINNVLSASGFARSSNDLLAGNSKWCQPLSRWKKYFNEWIYEPEPKLLMLASNIFDFRPVYGKIELAQEIALNIYEQLGDQKLLVKHLAKNALHNPPPLSFFRNFIVERGGEHKDKFDIKYRAMMPLSDAARVLVLDQKLTGANNTIMRFELLSEMDPKNALLFKEAAISYEILMRFRTMNGLVNGNSGRYINPEELNKIERKTLRNAFNPIADLQDLLITRFNLEKFIP
jgi:CBS domain-containing protein